MAYLTAAIVMTLSVLKVIPYCNPSRVLYFCTCAFISRFISAATCMFDMCKMQINKYFLPYVVAVGLCSHCMCRTSSQCI